VRLSSERLFAVCSPKLLKGRGRLVEPRDVLKHPLLHLDDRKDWSKWLDGVGVSDVAASHGPIMNRASMLIDAAIDGQGLALARTTLAAWDLINGRLVRPFDFSLPLSRTFWIVCPRPTATLPKVKLFREWLLAEAAGDLQRLRELEPSTAG
jgi:LysR family glycine cleavage system transcriptional activator